MWDVLDTNSPDYRCGCNDPSLTSSPCIDLNLINWTLETVIHRVSGLCTLKQKKEAGGKAEESRQGLCVTSGY